jgi:HD-GYP domain-containing protein (c-di-GMP phosphodiesterase class II)
MPNGWSGHGICEEELGIHLPARIPILYLILGIMVLVSVVPMGFYANFVVDNNREALKVNEQLLQNEITRSLREDIGQRQANLHTMLANFTTAVEVASSGNLEGDRVKSPQLEALLEKVVASSGDLPYATLFNTESRGVSAGRIQPDAFMARELERAFQAARQGRAYNGEPLSVGSGLKAHTLLLVSSPILASGRFAGMTAAFEDLQYLVDRLRTARQGGLVAYVVDRQGRLVAGATSEFATGQDMTGLEIVKNYVDQDGRVQFAPTMEFTANTANGKMRMLGTYSVVPTLGWAIVVQKSQLDAYQGVYHMQHLAWKVAILSVLVSMVISMWAARAFTKPLDVLTATSQAIARGDFSRRVHLKSRTEVGQLAQTFNVMTGSLQTLVADLKRSADENRSLFLSSIQMLAGAVDEKDPYTRGHSDRVTRYSVLLAQELDLPAEEIEKVRVAAQLHDVGKIGIEDRVLKKPGALTPEEYETMKAHTIKGANILRSVRQLTDMLPGIELHHESLDGRGYPYGLKSDEIPMLARIIMVADTFDAMTTNRPYQAAMDTEYVVRVINSLANTKFDPKVVNALTALFERNALIPPKTALPVQTAPAAMPVQVAEAPSSRGVSASGSSS